MSTTDKKMQWQSFLSQKTSNSTNANSSNSSLNNEQLVDLTKIYSLLEVSGEDAKTFLQGQLSNDINLIDAKLGQLSGYCNPKGRLLALFTIFSINNKIYLQLPSELLTKIQKRLQMFIMMSKVTIKDVSDELVSIGISGNNIVDLITEKLENQAEKNLSLTLSLIRLPSAPTDTNTDTNNRYQLIGAIDPMKALISDLIEKEEGIQLGDKNTWSAINIDAGIPEISEKTYEAFIPQMINLDLLGGVNFKKGCYTGQEVVARMHYLGKAKRLMYKIECDASSNLVQRIQAGEKLYSPDSNSSQGAGKIVSSSLLNDKLIALAVIEVKLIEKDTIYIDEDYAVKVQLMR